jgi:hypothetical protein
MFDILSLQFLFLTSLTFPGPLVEDGRETVTFDADTGENSRAYFLE